MSVTEDIKSRLDIVNFVSQYVPLKKSGRSFSAPCPFHSERTPSFHVFPESQTWRCFGACAEGGDIFNFLMKREGLDFPSALRLLADKAGVQLHERTQEQVSHDDHLDKLRGLLEETAHYFHNCLWEPEGSAARAYIYKRGLTDETLTHFEIGYAPNDWQRALGHLGTLGYAEDDLIDAGVAIRNDKGRVYDRFRNRLMIPIHDGRGLVIGFGARALAAEDNPKYLNSPQTALFDKSSVLFGFNHARRVIRESETAVIVEGYMDAIQAHQAGFTNVVAQMGTALTEPQLKQLSRYARRLILALDPDAAGIKATMRGLDVARQTLGDAVSEFDPKGIMRQASKLSIEIQVITLPEGQDPDDLIRDNPDAWRALIEGAQSVADYVIAAGTAHLTPQSPFGEREQIARQLLPILLATENDLQQHYNIQRLALRLHLDERTLIQWAQRQQKRAPRVELKDRSQPAPQSSPAPAPARSATPSNPPGSAAESYCLALLIGDTRLLYIANRRLGELAAEAVQAREALGPITSDDFIRSDFRAIFSVLEHALVQDDQEPLEYLKLHLPYELGLELDRLRVEIFDAYKQRLSPAMHAQLEAELEAARKKREWATTTTSVQMELEFVHKMLDLRKQRLIRDSHDIQFLVEDTDPDSAASYNHRLKVNYSAIRFIDSAASRVAQLQREH